MTTSFDADVDVNELTDSELDLLYKTQHPSYLNLSIGEQASSTGSLTVASGCPPGLAFLYAANALYLKPYSGPLMIGNVSESKRFEVLDGNGKRIFMICNAKEKARKWSVMEDDSVFTPHYSVHLIVLNHTEDEVFQYYGKNEFLKVGPNGIELPWGEVTRNLSSCCPFSRHRRLHFHVITEKPGRGGSKNDLKVRNPKVEQIYSIDGHMKLSVFPTESTEKLYYGTFDCLMSSISFDDPQDAVPVGQMSSSLDNERLGMSLPGMRFPKDLNVYHKAVLFGALLINVILK